MRRAILLPGSGPGATMSRPRLVIKDHAMKFLSFSINGNDTFGALAGDKVIDLGAKHGALRDLRDAIRADRLGELGAEAKSVAPDYALADVELLPTIPNAEKIICIGVNYANRNEEYKDGSEAPRYPSVFMRSRESLVGHGQNLLDPPESDQLDYEGEIVIVIGKEGRRIPEDRAHEYIAGLTIMNEGSLRDFLRHAKFNVTQGKNFAKSGSLGPWMVTPDELDPMGDLQIITTVNGEERQNDTTANIIFPFRYLISYLSTFYHLKPGDIIATGTPNGAGARFDPPKYLSDGDVVTVEVPGIGVLSNTVVAEKV
jgi:5-carboxymethyl-2-hydroxymuconate isomerase